MLGQTDNPSRPCLMPVPAVPSGASATASAPLGSLARLIEAAEAAGVPASSLLLSALARRDRSLAARSRRTAEWARLLAEAIGREDLAEAAHDTALMADIGALALAVPTREPGDTRRRLAGQQLLEAVPSLAPISAFVGLVDEQFDGSGEPLGLAGDDIPLVSRIVRLVRDFDLVSDGWWPGQPQAIGVRACAQLVTEAGQTVDPGLVHAWLRLLDRELADHVA